MGGAPRFPHRPSTERLRLLCRCTPRPTIFLFTSGVSCVMSPFTRFVRVKGAALNPGRSRTIESRAVLVRGEGHAAAHILLPCV